MASSSQIEFFDSDPTKVTEEEFFDFNPTDLQKLQTAEQFTDTDPSQPAAPAYVKEKTADDIKKMSGEERYQYAKDLTTQREYQQSKGFVKGAASGASLGASEYVPGLNPEEDDLLFGIGEFAGAALPITKLYNFLGKPLVSLAAKSPYAKKALGSLARMTGFGLTGAAYESTKQTVKEQKPPTPEEIVKYGAQWALFDGALQVVGKTLSFGNRLLETAKTRKVPERQLLNEVVEDLQTQGINPLENPDIAVQKAEEFLTREPIKTPIAAKEIKQTSFSLPEPIVETTGKGAESRIEYAPTMVDKSIETMNTFIKAAKSPGESLKRLGEATNKSIFNFLAPLETLESGIPISERVSTKIKLAQSASSEINSVLENGVFSNVTGNFEHEGLKGAYGDLTWQKFTKDLKPEDFSLQELDVYRTSKAALKRQSEGKKTGIDTALALKDVERLAAKYEVVDQRIREYQKAVLSHYGKDLLGEEMIHRWNEEYYSPLFRVMDSGKDSILKPGSLVPKQPFKKMTGSERKIIAASESDPYNTSMLISNAKKNEAVLQYIEQVQKGELPGNLTKGKQESVPKHVIEDLGLDEDMMPLAEALYNQTRKNSYTPEKNILRGWKNGKPIDVEVPDEIFEVFSTFIPQDRGFLAKLMGGVNKIFSRGISLEPRKFVSIAGRDALSSLVYSKTGSNPISIFEALGDSLGDKAAYKEFKALGGDVYASRLSERIDRAKKIDDLITPGKKGIMVPLDKLGSYFRKYADTLGDISMAVPLAEYKRGVAKYGNTAEGRIMAAMEARRVTYDPTRKGSSKIVREMGNYIPFWNVSLQDVSMLGKNLKNKETWVKGIGAITLPTLLLKMNNESNPDYQDLTPVDKAAFWHLYFGEKHIRVPIPWLLGTTFKVGAEFFYDNVRERAENGDPRAMEAWQALYQNFTDNLSGSLPPILQNYIEMTTGKSAPSPLATILGAESKAPPVIPKRLEGLPPELQYTSRTSKLVKSFGQYWGVSPIKLEKTLKTYGGLVAADALALIDEAAYASGLAEDNRPEQNEKNYLLLGNFISDNTPTRTKYQQEFYNLLREATLDRNAQKIIQTKGLQDIELDNVSSHGVNLFMYNRRISGLLKSMRTIEDSKEYTPAEKRVEMKELQKQINDLYKEAVIEVREGKEEENK